MRISDRIILCGLTLCLTGGMALAAEAPKEAAKPAAKAAGAADALMATLAADIAKHPGMSDAVKTFVTKTLLPQCTNPVFVTDVAKQNAKGLTPDAIKKTDAEWQAAEEPLPIQNELMNNATAKELKALVAKNGQIVEAFVTDNQGANVGQNALTSDYWQGDEEKWTNAFNKGAGGIDVGKEKFDKSANAPIQQISLPIIDTTGKVIGTVTWGVNISAMK